jgi:hypothetical protein
MLTFPVEPQGSTREPDRLGRVGVGQAAGADAADDPLDRGPGGDDVAQGADQVEHDQLGRLAGVDGPGTLGGDHDGGGAIEERRQGQLFGARHPRRVVEQLAEQQPHPPRLPDRPVDERARQGVDPRRRVGGGGERVEPAAELVGDGAEDRGIELLLAGEVVDHRGQRQAGGGGDVAHARPVEAALDQEPLGGAEDARAGALTFRGLAAAGHHPYERTTLPVRAYGF